MILDDHIVRDGELYHYGVVGMKWGVRRAVSKTQRRSKLERKAAKYTIKAEKARKKSDKLHAEELDKSIRNKSAKAAKFRVKAAKLMKKSLSEVDDYKSDRLVRKAEKNKLKAEKINREIGTYKRNAAYSMEANSLASKADKYTYKAQKVKYKLANDKRYTSLMKKRVSSLTNEELSGRYAFAKSLLDD